MINPPDYHNRLRDKLDQYGVSALDNSELLSLVIGVSLNHAECGRHMLEQYGMLSHIACASTDELISTPGIGSAKAARILAAFELAVRLAKEQIQIAPLDNPERIYGLFGPQLSHLPHERVLVATVDARLSHSHTTLVSVGTVSECTAHPREVMRPVIARAAYGFVLIHNHPSGDPSPSRADESITRRIAEVAGIMQVEFLDHVIIGKPCPGRSPYFSFREAGILS